MLKRIGQHLKCRSLRVLYLVEKQDDVPLVRLERLSTANFGLAQLELVVVTRRRLHFDTKRLSRCDHLEVVSKGVITLLSKELGAVAGLPGVLGVDAVLQFDPLRRDQLSDEADLSGLDL